MVSVLVADDLVPDYLIFLTALFNFFLDDFLTVLFLADVVLDLLLDGVFNADFLDLVDFLTALYLGVVFLGVFLADFLTEDFLSDYFLFFSLVSDLLADLLADFFADIQLIFWPQLSSQFSGSFFRRF